jgi:hypothetical protein
MTKPRMAVDADHPGRYASSYHTGERLALGVTRPGRFSVVWRSLILRMIPVNSFRLSYRKISGFPACRMSGCLDCWISGQPKSWIAGFSDI